MNFDAMDDRVVVGNHARMTIRPSESNPTIVGRMRSDPRVPS